MLHIGQDLGTASFVGELLSSHLADKEGDELLRGDVSHVQGGPSVQDGCL